MTTPADVTLIPNAIHNPDEPRHFMRVVPAAGDHSVSADQTVIAESSEAVIVKEVGRDIYDQVVYFPRSGVDMDALEPIDKTTHCPLKGNTQYFDVVVDGERIAEAAWSYVETIEVAAELRDLIAFDTTKVTVT